MAILEQLGINQSVFFQFGIFILSLVVLSQIVYGPYFAALEEREKRTKGGEDLAQELLKQATDLRAEYATKARQVSGDIKTIFDTYRETATKEYEGIVSNARAESQKTVEEARSLVSAQIADAAKKIKDEAPLVAQSITQKLLAR
jgi:F-type H+-transporting ATPase subunit b